MSGGRPLGIGLAALGGTLGGLLLLWLLVELLGGRLTPGGAVLGLLLVAVLALPLIGAGAFVLARSRKEETEAERFGAQRRALESDRVFRAERVAQLDRLALRLESSGPPGAVGRLRALAESLRRPGYDQSSWYEAVELSPADLDDLRRYDGLLSDGLRDLEALAERLARGGSDPARLDQAIDDWANQAQQRAELLQGRRRSAIAPVRLATAGTALESSSAVSALKPSDAIEVDGENFLVDSTISYFADGRERLLHRLVAERREGWLLVNPGGLDLAWLEAADAKAGDAEACSEVERFRADARVRTAAGQESRGGVEVEVQECAAGRLRWLERWEDHERALSGRRLRPSELEIYPSAVEGAS